MIFLKRGVVFRSESLNLQLELRTGHAVNAPTVMTNRSNCRAPTDFLLTNEFTDARSFLTTKNLLLFSSTPSTVFLLFPEDFVGQAEVRSFHR